MRSRFAKRSFGSSHGFGSFAEKQAAEYGGNLTTYAIIRSRSFPSSRLCPSGCLICITQPHVFGCVYVVMYACAYVGECANVHAYACMCSRMGVYM